MKDPYSVLGVARGAADDEIKRAYRRLAKRYHPDLNPGKGAVEQQFRDIASAYELLSDPAKRQRFDRGEIDAEGRERGFGFPPGGGRRARAGAASDFSLDDVLDQILRRGRRGGARAERGQTATAAAEGPALPVRLGFIEAALGGKRAVTLGDGRPVEVAIPAGIESGQKLRLRDAKAGDVFLEITVDPHPLFTRTGRDIQVETAMPLATAVLGGSITIPTIHGDVTVKVPKGSNGGATLRLKGKGIQGPGTAGDQYVKLKLVLPDPPDAELAVLLERWAQRARSPAR